MRSAPLALAAVLLASAAAAAPARGSYGTLTVYGPASGEEHSVPFEMLSVTLATPDGADKPREDAGKSARDFTTIGNVEAPDPALLAWAADSSKRRARLEVNDFAAATRSVYELEGARATTLSIGGLESGLQKVVIRADHLKINGQVIY